MRLVSAKRGLAEREGKFCWFPYYAGFSARFVEKLLPSLGLQAGSILLDPMNGCGTTTLVGQSTYPTIGIDLNPALVAIASAKNPSLLSFPALDAVVDHTVREVVTHAPVRQPPSHVRQWISPTAYGCLRALIEHRSSHQIPLDSRLSRVTGIHSIDPVAVVVGAAATLSEPEKQ